jgi:hypothetical protein
MPKKRRQAHIPSQTTRKRRTAKRPEFSAAPEERTDLAGNPIFADDVAVPVAAYDAAGPVETRPQWIGGSVAQRRPGRRQAQLRRTGLEPGVRVAAGQLPTFERGYLVDELRRIVITAGSLFAVVIVLAIIMR